MKNKSYLLLILLTIVLAFVLGVRYGQRVEKTNKTIDYLLTITPTPRLPTPTPVKYKEYKSKRWGLKFTLPENLEVKEDATSPAIMFELKK
jgi:hypothetical protein